MPIPLISPALAGSGPTLRDYWWALGDELGYIAQCTVSSTLATGEATRSVVINDLRDDEWDEAQRGDWWVYILTGDQAGAQRRVLSRGYHGPQGLLTLSRPLDAALEADDLVIVSWPLPVRDYAGSKGLVTHANGALNRIQVEGLLQYEGDGSNTTSLSDVPWLRTINQTTGLYDRTDGTPSADAMTRSGSTYDFRSDAADINLVTELGYSDGTEFALGVIVNADRLIDDGSGWGYADSPGLVADTDQAVPSVGWVRAFGMVKALQWLEVRLETDLTVSDAMRDRLLAQSFRRKVRYVKAANGIIRNGFPQPYIPPRRAMVAFSDVVSVPT